MHSSLMNATPLSVGDAVPDVRRHVAPSVIAFHSPHWDPARDAQLESYTRLLAHSAGDHQTVEPVLLGNDSAIAAQYGVAGRTAVFVVSPEGLVTWRYVSGIDPLPHPDATRVPADKTSSSDALEARCSRRQFVATALAAAVVLALEPTIGRAGTVAAQPPRSGAPVGDPRPVTLNVNGQTIALNLEPRVTLLDALREYAGLTGSKKGCDHGQCGACTVHVDGRRVLSCLSLAMMEQGKQITTIEGLAASVGATGDALHPVQQAFIDHDGFQCGYCTSGQIMSAAAVLHEPWGTSDDDVREAMSGNICRCGAYPGIIAAVQDARRHTGGGESR
jgi:xanthine dehydrogenase YagT iron-sulfur-binding subunit